jgi:hypothetical protein
LNAPGPAVLQGEHQTPSKHPVAVTTSVPGPQKSHGGGGSENTMGQPNGIETNKADYSSSDWTKNKEAAATLLRAKMAQAEQLLEVGQDKMAEKILTEVEEIKIKLAADPSSPQAQISGGGSVPKLDTEPGPASHVPDNGGMVSMTRASAKDSTTRESTRYFSEQPKKDNAVAAHVGRTDGQKISAETPEPEKKAEAPLNLAAARVYLQKLAEKANDPDASPEERQKAAGLIEAVKTRTGKTPEELLA